MSEKAPKVVLRPFTREDLEAMVRWNSDQEVEKYVDRCLPRTLDECIAWYNQNIPNRNYRLYAMEEDGGKIIGDLELDHICWKRKEAELRIRIGEKEYWNKGYGTLAIKEILNYAFGDLGLNRIYLRVYSFNTRAIHCYEKIGFRREASLKRLRDKEWKEILLMSISREDFREKT